MAVSETTQAIRAAFLDLYAEKPFERITIKELCERVPVGRTTFYAHFNNIDDVRAAVEDELLGDLCSIIERGSKGNVADGSLARGNFASGNLSGADFAAILTEVMEYVEDRSESFRAFLCIQPNARFIDRWKTIIRANLGRRYPQATISPNWGFMAEMAASAMIGAYTYLVSNPKEADRAQAAALIDEALSAAMDGIMRASA